MVCQHCQRNIDDDSAYCRFCGHASQPDAGAPSGGQRRLYRSPDGKIAGVCAGLAEYLNVDVTFVRVAWVVLSIVPGAGIGGVLAYLGAWLVMPERRGVPATAPAGRRLARSATDRKIAGVCGGLAEYFDVDPTPVRLLWVILTVLPGAILLGVMAYLAAWIVMPPAPAPATLTSAASAP
jgi:phage shock protein PspC (stress-responsive transcriptional regulator)